MKRVHSQQACIVEFLALAQDSTAPWYGIAGSVRLKALCLSAFFLKLLFFE
jgi:hypothetical protein